MSQKKHDFKSQYENFIGGQWTTPVDGEYFENISPVDGSVITKVARSKSKDIDLAVSAASKAFENWGKTSVTERSALLLKIAERLEENLEKLATVETWDNGKAIRETMAADLPLAIDHFRYFAGVIRSESGDISDLDVNTVSIEVHEPLGVVGQIIPWNFPILMAAWKIAPALAAGNCVVLKPAEQTPVSILFLIEIIADLLPEGILNVVNGFGPEAGKPLAQHPDIKKVAFTGETTTGRLIMQYASENIIPVTLELGGKSPNVFFESVMAQDDEFLDKAIEGLVLFAFNQGEVCTCPSRALIQESIYDEFMARCLKRIEAITMGDTLDASTMMGAQASNDQYEKILNYIDIGKQEGAEILIGGNKYENTTFPNGYYIQPTVFKGNNKMRIFQEEIFGPVLSVTTFKDEAEALEIANDTLYGRETHKMMLNHYRHTKNVLISYDKNKLGFF
ncbi:aldehyde dehydrogenase [Candidatus Thiomargarita nelsonii]|uniref:Aldehyde dehydrogenase n=1 Tax=Candidatus Thiomargarita nelsonii TaxID=1003181 RepID=A0A0A6RZ97_9GAMM|nr:aldehyde dehydrogenase [Candidatus Thiomargarita nelsonii]